MKRICSLLAALTFFTNIIFSQGNEMDDLLISQFVNSSEYNRVINLYNGTLGQRDVEKSNVTYIDDNLAKPVINIVLSSNNTVKGVLKAIPVPERFDNVLPGNERYVMTLIDYRSYNAENLTGNIQVVDANYDNHVPLDILVESSIITSVSVNDLPEGILQKYSGLLKKRDLGNPIYDNPENQIEGRHHCDLNGNGNVTWSECFTCMVRACSSNQQCAVLCGITNVVGSYVGSGGAGACTVSMAASCVYLSIVY